MWKKLLNFFGLHTREEMRKKNEIVLSLVAQRNFLKKQVFKYKKPWEKEK